MQLQAPGAPLAAAADAARDRGAGPAAASADVNAAQPDGMTALHWAALNGDTTLVDLLVAARAKVDPVTRLGEYTPLHLAAERGHGAIVTRLLAAGSHAVAVTTTGVQAIHFAADAGSVESVRALIDKGVDVNVKDATHGRMPIRGLSTTDAMTLLIRAAPTSRPPPPDRLRR
jgi:ankyrin repeat protein